jgi:hypothetical protein
MANATTVHASCNTAFSSAQLRRQVAPFDEPRSNPKPIKSLSVNELRRPGRIVRGLVIFRHEFLSGSFLRFRVPTRQTGSHENVEGLASRRFLFWAFPAGVSTISPPAETPLQSQRRQTGCGSHPDDPVCTPVSRTKTLKLSR